jgi:putative ABC transport system permease protein
MRIMSALTDARYAVRSLSHAKGFTLAAAATLAIGVASATLMFALVNGILLAPLPVRDADQLIVAWKRTPTGTFAHFPFGGDAVKEVRDHARSFESVGAFSYNGAMEFPAIEDDVASYLPTGVVDGEFFGVLGATPLVGRALTPADDAIGAEPVLVIDERLWQRRYNRATDVVGRRLRLFGESFAIVGVVPSVDLPQGAQAWITVHAGDARSKNPETRGVFRRDQDFVARLRAGVTMAQAADELAVLTEEHERRAGRSNLASVKSYTDEVVGDARTPVMMLFGATLLVLLIACANLANLVLLRGEARRAQLAVYAALGASRLQLARQVSVEALVLCGIGAAAGLLLAYWSLGAVIALSPPELPRLDSLRIDVSVVLFGAAIALVATAAASIVGALVSTNVTGAVLNSGGTRIISRAFRQSRRAFVVTQVALSLTILTGAGMLTRTLLQLESADMGFTASRMAFVELFFPPGINEDATLRRPFLEALTERVRAIPGVEDVTPVAVRPYAGLSGWDMPRWVAEGQGPVEAARNPGLDLQSVYPGHFETMGIGIVEGRAINRFDRADAPRAAVISENAARQVWPGQSAIGKRLKWGGVDSNGPWFTIVGVAATTRYRELAEPRAAVYLPAAQFLDGATSLALRLSVPLSTVTGPLRSDVRALNPSVFVLRAQSFDDYLAGPLARPRVIALLGNVFGIIALLLAAVGLYGVLAAFVRQSTREIGVRIALGATASHIRRLVLGEAARLAAVGVALGLAGAVATGRLLQGMLFGIDAMDPLTLAAAVAVLLLTALVACWFPLRRATRIDPVTLLRDN